MNRTNMMDWNDGTGEQCITAQQAKRIITLYSPDEIRSILRRLRKGTLGEITQNQADRLICKRIG